MFFSIRPFCRFPVYCPVTYHAGLCEGHGMIWNLSVKGWCISSTTSNRWPWKVLNERRIELPEAVARWPREGTCAAETVAVESHLQVRLQH